MIFSQFSHIKAMKIAFKQYTDYQVNVRFESRFI